VGLKARLSLGERIRRRVVGPGRGLHAIEGGRGVAPVQEDPPREVKGREPAGRHLSARPRHGRAHRPGVGRDVVDLRRVVDELLVAVCAPEDVDLGRAEDVDGRGRDRSLRHGRQCCPRVGNGVVAVAGVQGLAGTEGVAAEDVGVSAVGGTRPAEEVLRKWRSDLPARTENSRISAGWVPPWDRGARRADRSRPARSDAACLRRAGTTRR
jgi:hypothetical protein